MIDRLSILALTKFPKNWREKKRFHTKWILKNPVIAKNNTIKTVIYTYQSINYNCNILKKDFIKSECRLGKTTTGDMTREELVRYRLQPYY